MRALDRKLLRNLAAMRLQVGAIVLIVACGVAAFVTTMTAYRGLKSSRDAYYGRYRMADLWAPLKRMPRGALARLEQVEGVRRVEGRISFDVVVDLPEVVEPVSGRMISVPARRRQVLNDLHLVRGRWFSDEGTREVIVDRRFAEAHGLDVGDRLRVLMNDRKEALTLVAVALSPEFVYLLGGGQLLPDAERFTILWVSEPFAEAAFDFEGAVNEVVASLDRDVPSAAVVTRFDDLLDRYGALGAYPRDDQLSNRFVRDEIRQLQVTGQMIPALFLAVAAFVLHVLMGRLVRTQRTQIAVFRSFGYTTGELGRHYLKLALGVALLGAALGCGLGVWFARSVLVMYQRFFSFPVLEIGVDPGVLAAATLVSVLFSVLGAVGAVRAAARIAPAEGLRPESPRIYRRILLERSALLWRALGSASRMTLRHLARTKGRAVLTVASVALATSMILLTFWARDATDLLLDTEFGLVERQDVQIAFEEHRPRGALHEIRHLPGVRTAEPLLTVPADLSNGWRSRRTAILGLERGQTLRGLLDRDLRPVPLPEDGLMLSRKLAELLGLRVGDEADVEVLTGSRPRFRARVESVVDEYLGVFAYADQAVLSRWLDEESVVNGALLLVDPGRAEATGRALKDLPAVSSVNSRRHTVESFEESIGGTQGVMYGVLILFAGALAFGVLYNAARISLAERQREFGSMRVIGFTKGEVARLLLRENLLLVLLGVVPGLALGAAFAWLLSESFESDLYRFPFVLHPATVGWSAVSVLGFGLLASALVVWHMRRMDLVEVLKAKE